MIAAAFGVLISALLAMVVWLSREILWKLEAVRRELHLLNREEWERQMREDGDL